ncbi:MAG: hypothetical protein M3004_09350 [Bacteroidota bacterium]|nr:hypothetical protein [Bacteroidota bacterium]
MKKIVLLFLVGIFCSFAINSFAQQDQRIHAAFMLAFGRDATQTEVNYWLGKGNLSIAQIIEFHRQGLKQYPDLHRETIIKSYKDAMGRIPKEDEIKFYMPNTATYAELVATHINWLQTNNLEYEKVFRLAYATVFHRVPTNTEVAYWKNLGVFPYYLLLGYHEDYKRKNQNESGSAGRVNLIGVPSVIAILLSPAIAAEAKIIGGNASAVISTNGTGGISHDGGSIVAAGAVNLVAPGLGN